MLCATLTEWPIFPQEYEWIICHFRNTCKKQSEPSHISQSLVGPLLGTSRQAGHLISSPVTIPQATARCNSPQILLVFKLANDKMPGRGGEGSQVKNPTRSATWQIYGKLLTILMRPTQVSIDPFQYSSFYTLPLKLTCISFCNPARCKNNVLSLTCNVDVSLVLNNYYGYK